MSDDVMAIVTSSESLTPLHLLVEEASRQLDICNACRYCEGLCAVYPALERRGPLDVGDISQLANLCHDCRACYDACMYTPPHAYGVNVPKVLAAVRVHDYRRYVWPANPTRWLRGWLGVFSGAGTATLLVLTVAVVHLGGFSGLIASDGSAASPYELIPYPALLVVLLIPTVFAIVVMISGAIRFWRATASGLSHDAGFAPVTTRSITRAIWYAATLRYLRGGGGNCYYPESDQPAASRRRLHAAVASGFVLCLVSTTAAAVTQDFFGQDPPYPVVSVPVLAGLIGGVGLVVGCLGLLLLKARAAGVMSVSQMTIKDYGLLTALTFLALTGLGVFLVRSTPAFGIVFLVHMAAVVFTFAAAPYSKFTHLVYRFLALVRDNAEVEREAASRNTAP